MCFIRSVLFYGCEAWTLTVKNEKALDGVYTRMLRAALNVSWEDHISNVDLYGNLPRLSDTIRQRRMRLAGHCETYRAYRQRDDLVGTDPWEEVQRQTSRYVHRHAEEGHWATEYCGDEDSHDGQGRVEGCYP